MYEWITPVYVEYSAEEDGFQIYRKEGEGIYKLVACNDMSGNFIYAIGCNNSDFDAYSYWNIYEVVVEEEEPVVPNRKLVKVSEIETGKDYVIVNKSTGTVLTTTIESGNHWYAGVSCPVSKRKYCPFCFIYPQRLRSAATVPLNSVALGFSGIKPT